MNSIINYIAKQFNFTGVTHDNDTACRSAARNELNGVMHHIENNDIEYFEVERVLHHSKEGRNSVRREVVYRCLNESVARAWCDVKWCKESARMGTTDSYHDVGVCWEWERVNSSISRCYDLRVVKRVISCKGSYSLFNDVIGGCDDDE